MISRQTGVVIQLTQLPKNNDGEVGQTHRPNRYSGKKRYISRANRPLAKSNRAAIAQLVTRGKEQLALIRPYENGLIMHSLYYANEVRNFADIAKGENMKLSDKEIELGADLIEKHERWIQS